MQGTLGHELWPDSLFYSLHKQWLNRIMLIIIHVTKWHSDIPFIYVVRRNNFLRTGKSAARTVYKWNPCEGNNFLYRMCGGKEEKNN